MKQLARLKNRPLQFRVIYCTRFRYGLLAREYTEVMIANKLCIHVRQLVLGLHHTAARRLQDWPPMFNLALQLIAAVVAGPCGTRGSWSGLLRSPEIGP